MRMRGGMRAGSARPRGTRDDFRFTIGLTLVHPWNNYGVRRYGHPVGSSLARRALTVRRVMSAGPTNRIEMSMMSGQYPK